jgi:uncharacterized protein
LGDARRAPVAKQVIIEDPAINSPYKEPRFATTRGYMNVMRIEVPKEKFVEFCRTRHIRWIACFGSVLRDDFRSDSDVDVLVEFAPGRTPGWEILDIEEDLSELLGGRKVDIVNPRYLNRRLKERVLAEAEVLYAEG